MRVHHNVVDGDMKQEEVQKEDQKKTQNENKKGVSNVLVLVT